MTSNASKLGQTSKIIPIDALLARAAFRKRLQAARKESMLEYRRDYHKSRYEFDPEYRKKYIDWVRRYNHSPKVVAYRKAYVQRPEVIERMKLQHKLHYAKNKEKIQAAFKRWREADPERDRLVRLAGAKRRYWTKKAMKIESVFALVMANGIDDGTAISDIAIELDLDIFDVLRTLEYLEDVDLITIKRKKVR